MAIPNRGGRGPPCPLGKNAYDYDYDYLARTLALFAWRMVILKQSHKITRVQDAELA